MKILLLILIAYLLGSIQTGLWIGKLFFHINLREHGSGNTGTTNTFRVLGKTAGTITFLVDMFKGTLAVLLPIWLGVTEVSPLIIGFFAIIGHVFPIFAGFKGGKAVATSAGVLLGFAPLYCVFLLLVFALTLYLTSMNSFSSVTAANVGLITLDVFTAIQYMLDGYDLFFFFVFFFLFSRVSVSLGCLITLAVFPAIHFLLDGYDLIFTGVLTIMALIIIFRHTENMGRIRRHQENLVPFGLNLTKQNPNK